MNNSIIPGAKWLDTNGKAIQAHGFSVMYENGFYYWYGENKEYTKGGSANKIWHWGVRCYRSKDLYNWEDCGLIIPPEPENLRSPLHPTYQMDRPHIVFCPNTQKYVAWLKIMTATTSGFFAVMQADKFLGPYEFVHRAYYPHGMSVGDFTVVTNQGTAFIIFERPHFQLITSTLSEDYTGVTDQYSVHYDGLKPPYTREAPAYFKRKDKHYLLTSGTSGYFPNKTQVCVFDDFHGAYTDFGNPCINDKTMTTFNSQISGVLKIPGKEIWVAYADRWKPGIKSLFASKLIEKGMSNHFKDYKPDTKYQEFMGLPGKEVIHKDNTSKSRYVWLPIEWQDDKPIIRWRNNWRLEDLQEVSL